MNYQTKPIVSFKQFIKIFVFGIFTKTNLKKLIYDCGKLDDYDDCIL